MNIAGLKPADRDVEGVVEMMMDATRNYQQPVTSERLFAWHAAKLTKTSQDTAARDIAFLVERGILARNLAGVRSTSYSLHR